MSEDLGKSRRRFERALAYLQDSIESEIGWAPRAFAWVVPLVGFAAGLALGMTVRRAVPARRRARRLDAGDGFNRGEPAA